MASIFRYTIGGDYSAQSSDDIYVGNSTLSDAFDNSDPSHNAFVLREGGDPSLFRYIPVFGLEAYLHDGNGLLIDTNNFGVYLDYSGGVKPAVLEGTENGDILYGGNGNGTSLAGYGGNDKLRGGTGTDHLGGGSGNDLLDGGAGADSLNGGLGIDTVTYANSPSGVNVNLSTGDGFAGHAAGDRLFSIENLTGSTFSDTLSGDIYDNVLNDGGVGGNDTLLGGAGNDTYVVYNAGSQPLEGVGEGTDRVAAGVDYVLVGGTSVEYLNTTSVNGTRSTALTGNELKQLVRGNAGANVLDGGGGKDILYGMGGSDTFKFSTSLSAANVAKVMDFVAGEDKIALDHSIFSMLDIGALDPSFFKINTDAPRDADDRVLYNGVTGSLFYDADGLGGAVAVKVAMLSSGLALTGADFIVV